MPNIAYVSVIPNCDICGPAEPKPAVVDARTIHGPWASMCDEHWRQHTPFPAIPGHPDPKLGTGVGQRYVLGEKPQSSNEEKRDSLMAAIESGDLEAAFEIVGDGDFEDFL